MVHTVRVLYIYIKAPHHKAGEVISCHLEQQLVLCHAVRGIRHHKEVVRILLCRERTGRVNSRSAQLHATTVPHIAEVKLGAMQFLARAHSVYNHTSHSAHATLRILLDYSLHRCHALIAVAVIEFRHAIEENKAVTVITQREARLRECHVVIHLLEAVILERLVCGTIERILYMLTKLGILSVIRVC